MTTEQLDKAKELQKKIGSLKDHLYNVSKVRKSNKPYLRADSANNCEDLNEKYLPINFEQYIGLYVQNVEKEIAELEQQFKAL